MNLSRLKESSFATTTTTTTTTTTKRRREEKETKKKEKEEMRKQRRGDNDTWLRRREETCLGRWCRWANGECPTTIRLLLLAALLFSSLTTGSANFDKRPMVQRLEVPEIVDPRTDRFELRCIYDLQGRVLYSVNWYKNGDVLFSYTPSISSNGSAYPKESDVRVSVEQSNDRRLVLLGYQDFRKNMRAYEGTYACEVSIEKTFHTDYAMANVSVAILPKNDPVLEGIAHNYHVGEQLDAACNSGPSLPPAELTFYLNGDKVDPKYTHRENSLDIGEALGTTRLSISLRLERHHFRGESLIIRCDASLPGTKKVYSTEKVVILAARNQPHVQEPPKLPSSSKVAGLDVNVGQLMLSVILSLLFFIPDLVDVF